MFPRSLRRILLQDKSACRSYLPALNVPLGKRAYGKAFSAKKFCFAAGALLREFHLLIYARFCIQYGIMIYAHSPGNAAERLGGTGFHALFAAFAFGRGKG